MSAQPPTLKSLPPTDEALELNIKRAHYQAMMWNKCIAGQPTCKEPCDVSVIPLPIIFHHKTKLEVVLTSPFDMGAMNKWH